MSGSTSPNITFSKIPSNLRIHGAFVEFDPNANTAQQNYRALLIGQMLTGTGTATPGVAVISAGKQDAVAKGGAGSNLAAQAAQYYTSDNFGEVWLLPLSDPSGGARATGTILLAGTALSSGTLSTYVAGTLVPLTVAAGTTAAAAATALAGLINANVNLRVTATVLAGTVTVQAKNAGLLGNDLALQANYLGTAGGEAPVPGLTMSFTAMTGGAGIPDIADALANLPADVKFNFVAFPFTDTASLNEWQLFMDDNTGRWSWEQMLYGGAFAALHGTLGAATTFLTGRNDPAICIMPIADAPQPADVWGAELCAQCAVSVRANPAVPLQNIVLNVMAPSMPLRFTPGERNTMLFDGGSTFTVNDAGQCITDRLITTYQTNAAGVPDDSYLDVETRYTLDYVATDLRTYLLSKYSRKIFVEDTTRLTGSINNAVVTPSMIRTSVVSRYYYLESQGLVQNADAFAKAVQVQKVGSMARILWPGDIANQLRQFGISIAFSKS